MWCWAAGQQRWGKPPAKPTSDPLWTVRSYARCRNLFFILLPPMLNDSRLPTAFPVRTPVIDILFTSSCHQACTISSIFRTARYLSTSTCHCLVLNEAKPGGAVRLPFPVMPPELDCLLDLMPGPDQGTALLPDQHPLPNAWRNDRILNDSIHGWTPISLRLVCLRAHTNPLLIPTLIRRVNQAKDTGLRHINFRDLFHGRIPRKWVPKSRRGALSCAYRNPDKITSGKGGIHASRLCVTPASEKSPPTMNGIAIQSQVVVKGLKVK